MADSDVLELLRRISAQLDESNWYLERLFNRDFPEQAEPKQVRDADVQSVLAVDRFLRQSGLAPTVGPLINDKTVFVDTDFKKHRLILEE